MRYAAVTRQGWAGKDLWKPAGLEHSPPMKISSSAIGEGRGGSHQERQLGHWSFEGADLYLEVL